MDRSFHICIPVRLNQQRDLQIQHEPINSSVIQHTLARANWLKTRDRIIGLVGLTSEQQNENIWTPPDGGLECFLLF